MCLCPSDVQPVTITYLISHVTGQTRSYFCHHSIQQGIYVTSWFFKIKMFSWIKWFWVPSRNWILRTEVQVHSMWPSHECTDRLESKSEVSFPQVDGWGMVHLNCSCKKIQTERVCIFSGLAHTCASYRLTEVQPRCCYHLLSYECGWKDTWAWKVYCLMLDMFFWGMEIVTVLGKDVK